MNIKRLWKKLVTGPTKRDLKQIIEEYRVLTSKLNTENSELQQRNRNLQSQLTALAAPRGSGQALVGWESQGASHPQFAFLGVARAPGQGVRLYASRELGGVSFGASGDGHGGNSGYMLRTAMGNMLTIDKPDYRQAIEHLFTIWAWQGDQREIEQPKE